MINEQNGFLMKMLRVFKACLILFFAQIASVKAVELAITQMDVATQAGDQLQIQLEMNGPAVAPRAFKTDNPARIALDFSGVKNGLPQKTYPINQGVVNSLYVAEAADRVRVVLNLTESAPFDIKTDGRKVLLTLNNAKRANVSSPSVSQPVASSSAVVNQLIPQQSITGFDFKRGDKGEGRILISLANPNTVVNTREEGGNVVVSFMNTQLPAHLSKRMDVSEFATPVKYIDAASTAKETTVSVALQNTLYDYSLFQSEGLLTVEFRPLTTAEKEALQNQRDKYTGDRLSLNFQDIDIRSVIAVLAEFTGQNVVAGDDVTGTVTVKLDDVPWDEALDFIMMTKGLEKYETGNVTLVAPVGKIKDYKEKQRAKETIIEQLDPLTTEYLKINYAKAENFRNLLYGVDSGGFVTACSTANTNRNNGTSSGSSRGGSPSSASTQAMSQQTQQQSNNVPNIAIGPGANGALQQTNSDKLNFLSERGTAVVDSRTNTLIVRETPKRLEDIKKLIRRLDVPVRQVMIESRIAIATNDYARELGVRFGVAKMADIGHGKHFAIGGAGTRSNSNAQPDENGNIGNISDTLVDLAASNPYGTLGMTLARGADYVLNLELSALQDQARGQLLSNPRVMTTDRCTATISQGTSIPYQTSGANVGTNVQFIDALLQLQVTPQITPSGSINMNLNITRDTPVFAESGEASIDTSAVQTNVLVNDGETVVLGGIYQQDKNNAVFKVPFFADIPGIGFLFKKNVDSDAKKELLVFITPKIVKDLLATNNP